MSQNLLFNLDYSLFFTQNSTKFRISSFDPSGTSTINSPFPSSVFKPMRYKQIKYKLNNAGTARLLPASFNVTSNVFFCYVSGVHNFQNGGEEKWRGCYNFSERRHSLFALSNAPQIFIMNVNHRVLKSNDCLFLLHIQFHPTAALFSPALPNSYVHITNLRIHLLGYYSITIRREAL